MESNASLENLNTASVWTKSIKKTFAMQHLSKNYDANRCATDKCWIGFFILILISWIIAWQYVVQHESDFTESYDNSSERYITDQFIYNEAADYNIVAENDTTAENISEILQQETNNTNSCKITTPKKKDPPIAEILCTLRDFVVLNPANINAYMKIPPELPEVFYIIEHIGFSFAFFVLSLLLFWLDASIPAFLIVVVVERLSIIYHSSDSSASILRHTDKKLAYWLIPEIVFFILWLSIVSAKGYSRANKLLQATVQEKIKSDYDSIDDDVDNDNSDDEEAKDGSDDDSGDKDIIVSCFNYIYAFTFGIPFTFILKLLVTSTINTLYRIGWSNPYSYIIAGGSCYIGLTIYYFGKMLTACATNILFDSKHFILGDLLRALFIVSRYHFGTACYHATLIFPRLQAIFVSFAMNKSELKIDGKHPSLYRRFTVAYRKVYKFSPTLTAMRGLDHSDSIKELLRIFDRITLKKKYFQIYPLVLFIILSGLLLSVNCLTLLSLKNFAPINSDFAQATWNMYAKIMLTYMLIQKFFIIVPYTVGLHVCSGKRYYVRRGSKEV